MKYRRALFLILRICVTAGLLYLVFSGIDLYDKIVLRDGERTLTGRVLNRREIKEIEKSGVEFVIIFRDKDDRERRISSTEVLPEATLQLADHSTASGILVLKREDEFHMRDKDGATTVVKKSELDTDAAGGGVSISYFSRGFISILATIYIRLFLLGFLLYGVINFTGVLRWMALLRVQQIGLSFLQVTKLTFLGIFFNNVMPGMTGGDAVKAYYATRVTDRKAGAAISVLIDRLIGIFCLALLSGGAVLLNSNDPRFRSAGYVIIAFMAAAALCALIMFSRRMRRLFKVKKLIGLIPFEGIKRIIREIDQAVFIYRYHKKAVLFAFAVSLLGHSFGICANFVFARAIGVEGLGIGECFVFLPVIFMIMALPISLAGWGVGERSYSWLLPIAGVGLSESTAMGVLFNLTRTIWSLPGALVVLMMGKKPTADEIKRELEEDIDREIEESSRETIQDV